MACRHRKCANYKLGTCDSNFAILSDLADVHRLYTYSMRRADHEQVTVKANNLSDTVNDGSKNHSACSVWSAGFLLRCHHFLCITLLSKYEWEGCSSKTCTHAHLYVLFICSTLSHNERFLLCRPSSPVIICKQFFVFSNLDVHLGGKANR